MSAYLAGAAICGLIATVLLTRLSVGQMYGEAKHNIKMEDEIVFHTASIGGVAFTILTASGAIITTGNITGAVNRSSVVVIVATCTVLIVVRAVQTMINKKQPQNNSTTRKYT